MASISLAIMFIHTTDVKKVAKENSCKNIDQYDMRVKSVLYILPNGISAPFSSD